jgi:hypothetical protein
VVSLEPGGFGITDIHPPNTVAGFRMMRLTCIIICALLMAFWDASCRTSPAGWRPCPFDNAEVLTQLGLVSNVVPIQAICWKQKKDDRLLVVDEVLLLGTWGTNFVLVSASRNPRECDGRWRRIGPIVQSWTDENTVGLEEFSHLPSKKEVEDVKGRMGWKKGPDGCQTVFWGEAEIMKPTPPRTIPEPAAGSVR